MLKLAGSKGVLAVHSITTAATPADIAKELTPGEGEPIVKAPADKFFKTELEKILNDKGIKTVVVVGTAAQGAVLNTASQAAFQGLQVIIPVTECRRKTAISSIYHLSFGEFSWRRATSDVDQNRFNQVAGEAKNNFTAKHGKESPTMSQLDQAQKNQLTALKKEFKRLQKQLEAIHKKIGYEDLAHGVLALQIAEHTVEETLEHTGLGGEITRKPNPSAYRRAKNWYKIVKGLKNQGDKFLKTHPSEDLETALKALEIAEGSLEEVAERYE